MADDDPWGELFAKASGKETVTQEEVQQPDVEKSKRKKRRRSRKKDQPNHALLLEGRMKIPSETTTTEWPTWARLGESMLNEDNDKSSVCRCWIGKDHAKCNSCGRTALFHALSTSDACWPSLHVFCSLRNLRCVGVLMATEKVPTDALAGFACNESYLLVQAVRKAKSSLGDGEDEVLESKCQGVRNAVDAIFDVQSKKKQDGAVPDLFAKAVRLVIACDDLYYRLYYLSISSVLPLGGLSLPHPAEYFHIPFLAWVGMERSLREWRDFVDSLGLLNDEKLREEISARYGIDISDPCQLPQHTHVLSYLHTNRAMETVRLFYKSGWISKREAEEQTMKALEMPVSTDGLSRHDTPAPPILSEWRDSCRDRLCNLYAYATVSNEAVGRIKNDLKNAGIAGGVIEVGAGSGYLAALFQEAGIPVVAWDVHPPGSRLALNEYHGHTPGFCEISKGSPSDLRRHPTAANVALLLCYTPPESSMAKDALEAYLDVGGRCLVHIGEFGGLTGSPAFESLLVPSCYCVDRFPCLAWGTDAAEVTVWIRADGGEQGKREQRLLLPCSNCGKAEASRQCRLVRHVAYCGSKCFELHSHRLTTHFAMNMIPIKAEALSFDDDRHFIPIRTGKKEKGKKKARHSCKC